MGTWLGMEVETFVAVGTRDGVGLSVGVGSNSGVKVTRTWVSDVSPPQAALLKITIAIMITGACNCMALRLGEASYHSPTVWIIHGGSTACNSRCQRNSLRQSLYVSLLILFSTPGVIKRAADAMRRNRSNYLSLTLGGGAN